jgi:hypothetical protein
MTAPGMAAHQATDSQEGPSTGTVDPNGLIGVGRARGQIAAPGRASHPVLLVEADERKGNTSCPSRPNLVPGRDRGPLGHRGLGASHRPAAVTPVTAPAPVSPTAARRAWIIAFLNSVNESPAAPGPVLTRYAPAGVSSWASTNRARNWRRRRFLTTALPTFRLIAKANCGRDQECSSRYVTETEPAFPRLPDRRRAENVCLERIRSILVLGTGILSSGEVTLRADDAPSIGATE